MKDILEALNKFAESATGKIVLVAATVVIALIALFLVYKTFFAMPATDMTKQPVQNETQASNISTTAPQNETTEATLTMDTYYSLETGFEVFSKDVLRDPFIPINLETTPTTQTTSTVVQTVKPLVFLGSVYDDGILKAAVSYDGSVYNLAPGETIGPYLVVAIEETSARFLYGDMPFTLQVGQSYSP
jgi:hypothetical protein